MLTVYAVEIAPDEFVCFYRDEFKDATNYAKAKHTEVVEWTVSYRDLHELNFYNG